MTVNAQDGEKAGAAAAAVDLVQSGMIVGLGSGTTARMFVDELGHRLNHNALHDVRAVATSVATEEHARALGIPLLSNDDCPNIDLGIDGADEVDPNLQLIKGRGGALLREKIVAHAANRFVIIVDSQKLVDRLGTTTPLPVEVTAFAWRAHARFLEELGCRPVLRTVEGRPFVTDNANYILDCHFEGGISDPASLAQSLRCRTGIIEHGLFLNMTSLVLVGDGDGVRRLTASSTFPTS